MLANLARLSKDMAQAKGMVSSATQSIEKSVALAKQALGALGIGLGVGYFASLIKGAIDAADNLRDLSKTTMIAVEDLGGLRLLAKQTGGDLESMATSINKLGQNIGKDTEKFKQLGITAKDPLKAFQQLADIFSQIQDPQLRAAFAADTLGKSWAGAAPALSEGGARIAEIVEKGKRLAGITKEMTNNADEFNDQMAELSTTLGATRTKLVSELLPGMNEIAGAMKEAAKEGGLLLTIWVGLGGAMANLLGLTDSAKVRARLGEIHEQLELARKQLQAGTLNPAGGSSSFWSFLIPDVKLREEALAELRKTIAALEAEKARLTPPGPAAAAPPDAKAVAAAEAKARAALDFEKTKAAAEAAAKKAAAEAEAAQKKEAAAYEQVRKAISEKTAVMQAEIAGTEKLSDAEQMALKIMVELRDGALKLTEAHRAQLGIDVEGLLKLDQELKAKAQLLIVNKAMIETVDLETRAQQHADEAFADRNQAHSQARQDSEQQLSLIALEINALSTLGPQYGELTARTLEYHVQRETLLKLRELDNEEKREEHRLNQLGLTDTQRAIELDKLYKQTRERRGQIPDEIRRAQTSQAQLNEARRLADAQQAIQVDMWQSVDQAARDTFSSIFDSGKSTLDRLRDTLKNGLHALLYQLTLRPILINVATMVGGAGVAQQAFGASAVSGAGSSGLLNLLSTGNSAYSVLTGGGIGASLFGSAGAYAAAVPGLTSAAVGSQAAMLAAQTGVFGSAGLGATVSSAGAAGAGAALSAIGAALPYIGIALAAAGALGLFGSNKTAAVGTGYNFSGDFSRAGGLSLFQQGLTNVGPDLTSSGNQTLASQVGQALVKGLDGVFAEIERFARMSGLDSSGLSSASASFAVSTGMGQAEELKAVEPIIAQVANQLAEQLVPNLEEYRGENESAIQTLIRLGGELEFTNRLMAIMGKNVETTFGGIGWASIGMRDKLVTLMGGLSQASALTQSFYENFFTDTERFAADLKMVNTALREIGISTVPRTRAEFRALVEAQDLNSTAGQEMFTALMKLAPAFAAVTKAADESNDAQRAMLEDIVRGWADVGKTLREYRDSLFSNDRVLGLSYGRALAQFDAVSISARLGDIDAAKDLKDASEAFRRVSEQTSTSSNAYIRDLARIQTGVTGTITTADQQVSIAQKQLDELRNISSLLGGIPGHAGGGVASGLSWVGEAGPELVNFMTPARVYTSADSRAMMGGNTAALEARVDRLIGETAALREEMRSGVYAVAKNTRKSARLQDKWDFEATPVGTSDLVVLESSTTSQQALPENAARRGVTAMNTDANECYLKYGANASATSFKVRIPQNAYWEMPEPIYTGRIDVIWAANGVGQLLVDEV